MNEKITFHQLASKLSELTGGNQTTSELFIKEFFATITEALKKDGNVKIKNFGTFILSNIKGDISVKFAPDKDIAEAINMPFSCFEAVELNDDVTDEILNTQEHNDSSAESPNPNTTIDIESEVTDVEQPVTDDELCPVEPEPEVCTEAETDDTPLSSVDIDDGVSDEIVEPVDVPRKCNWLVSVLCLIAGLVTGYLLYPVINHQNVSGNETPVAVIADTIEDVSNDTLPLPVEDSVKITATVDSISIAKPVVVYDTIGKSRFLTTMSREYYGRMEFWVYIYEENKANLGNPNRIKPGTAIIIPPADKYGIDKNNPDCIEKAKLKAMEIYAPYEK